MRAPARLAVGHTQTPRTVGPVTITDLVRFAGAGGDFNPLHHDPQFAARAGFTTNIAHGQLTAGLLAAWVSDWVGVEHLRSFEVRFVAPVFVGDTLTLSGTVTELRPSPAGPVATIEVTATKEDEVVVVKGAAQVLAGTS
jgi:acyl dehydratase